LFFNLKKDVLVLFSLPPEKCPQCAETEALYAKVAEKLATNKNLVFTRIDPTENELAGQRISGYPSIKFYTAT